MKAGFWSCGHWALVIAGSFFAAPLKRDAEFQLRDIPGFSKTKTGTLDT